MLNAQQREYWADHFESQGVDYVFFSAALARRRIEEREEAEREERERAEREEREKRVREELKRMGLSSSSSSSSLTVGGGGLGSERGGNASFYALEEVGEGVAESPRGEVGDDASVLDTSKVSKDEDFEESEEEEEDDDDGNSENEDDKATLEHTEISANSDPLASAIPISHAYKQGLQDSLASEPERIRILSCDELLDRIAQLTPSPTSYPTSSNTTSSSSSPSSSKVTIGFVGYPNVGKSSTLNALVGSKKVTVSATPGKTKHFQTIHLDDKTILCDCPGLVFPSFATTKAEMVVNGVLPIDQLREHTGPATLIAQRIPRHALEAIYGIRIRTLDKEGNLDSKGVVRGEDLCAAYAVMRGFKKAGQGNPDESRAARILLKDYVQVNYFTPIPHFQKQKTYLI
jgi:large subunit GTPase 1